MDPDVTLTTIRAIIARFYRLQEMYPDAETPECLADLVEHVEAIDNWLMKGGFLPKSWDQLRKLERMTRPTSNGKPIQDEE